MDTGALMQELNSLIGGSNTLNRGDTNSSSLGAGSQASTPAGLLQAQQQQMNEAMAFQTESTNQQMRFQMHAAAERNRGAMASAVANLSRQQSQALAQA